MHLYLGTNVKNFLIRNSISNRQIALATGLSVSTVIRIREMGDNPDFSPNSASVFALADYMGVDASDILYRDIYEEHLPVRAITPYENYQANLASRKKSIDVATCEHVGEVVDNKIKIFSFETLLEASATYADNLESFYKALSHAQPSYVCNSVISTNSNQHGFKVIGNDMAPALSKGDVIVFQLMQDVAMLPSNTLVLAEVEPREGLRAVVVRYISVNDFGEVLLVKNEMDTAPLVPTRILGLVVGRYTEFHTS